jgi:endonuclease YncB( thermonuclease family)
MRALITILVLILVAPSWAADAIIKDGDTLRLSDNIYRLDGIDAPELDQVCLDEKGAVWVCGIEARDQLIALIGKRAVRCDDKGPDPVYPKIRRIGICWVEGETVSLNQWLVREGWAVNFEPYARGRFKADEDDAQKNRRGLWKGCFTAPRDFRRWNKNTAELLGPTCAKQARNMLFPDDPAMPPGCTIKGKFALRAKITGHRGIYHIEGCRSYQRLKRPDRWFCSEEDAQAAGFRKAFNCTTSTRTLWIVRGPVHEYTLLYASPTPVAAQALQAAKHPATPSSVMKSRRPMQNVI